MPFIQLQFRRGNASQWTSANPILADGELAIESDTSKFKIGNGIGSWTLLPYGGLVGPTGAIDNVASIDISFNGNIFVGKDVSFGGKLAVRNDASFNTELRVGGNININSGAITSSSSTGALIVGGGVGVGGNVWSGGNLIVALDAYLNSHLLVGGNVIIGANLRVGTDASFNGNVTFANLPYYNGAVVPGSNQLVTKSYVDINGGGLLLGSNNTWTANNTFNGSRFYVNADASFQNKLTVGDDVSLNARFFVGRDSSLNGNVFVGKNLMVGADASFNGNVFIAKTLNLKKMVVTGAAIGGPTSIVVTTPIVELTGSGASTAYFTLTNGSYAGQTLTINSATNGGGGGLYVNSNFVFNGSNCLQMRFSNAFQTVNLIWGADVSQWIVASWQGVNFANSSMNFGTYISGDITLGAAGKVNINPSVGGMIVGSDSSFNGNLSVGGTDSSFNANLYVGVGKRVGIGKLAGETYLLDVGGNINLTGNLFTNGVLFSAFDNSKDVSLNAKMTVAFDSSFNASLFVGGSIVNTGLTAALALKANIAAPSFTGLIVSAGDVSLNRGLRVALDSSFNTNLFVGGSIVNTGLTDALALKANIAAPSFTGTIVCAGDVSLNARLRVALDSSFNASIFVGGSIVNTGLTAALALKANIAAPAFTGLIVSAGDVSLNRGLRVALDSSFNANLYVERRLTGNSDISLNGRLTVGGTDSSFNGNLYVGGYINSDTYVERFVNVASSTDAYTADFNNGLIIYINAFSGSSTPTLSITNLPTLLNQSYVFTIVYNGAATSTYFSALNINGISVPVNGSVSLTAASSYYVHQFCIFFTDATTISNNFVLQSFNSSAPLSLVSPSVTGNLSVNGNINLTGGDIYKNGTLFTGGGTSSSISGNLFVDGDVSLNSKLTGNGDVSLNQRLFVGGDVSLNSKLTGNGDVSLNQRLFVGGDVSLNSKLTGNGDVSLNQRLFVGDDVSFGGNLNIRKTTVSTSSVTGALVVAGGVGISGAVNVGIITESTSSITGALIVSGGIGVAGNAQVGGNIKIFSSVASISSVTGALVVGGGVGIGGAVYVGSITESTSSITGALIVGGGAGIGGNVRVGGNINIASSIASTSSVTGALVVGGGVGIGGDVQVGGIIRTTNTVASTSSVTGALIVAGGAGIGGNVRVGGNVNIASSIASAGSTTGALVVVGGVGIGGDLYLNGIIRTTNTVASTSSITGALIVAGGAGIGGSINALSFNATSDYRIKHNVSSLFEDASFNVDVLRPVSFVNITLGKQDIGFIAHEVQEHYPYLVNGEKDGVEMQTLNYTGIIGILVKEIQDLKRRVAKLE